MLCAPGREELSWPAWTAVGPAGAGPSQVGRVDTMPGASLLVVLSGSFFLHTPHSHVSVWTEQLPRGEEGPGCKRGWRCPEPPLQEDSVGPTQEPSCWPAQDAAGLLPFGSLILSLHVSSCLNEVEHLPRSIALTWCFSVWKQLFLVFRLSLPRH